MSGIVAYVLNIGVVRSVSSSRIFRSWFCRILLLQMIVYVVLSMVLRNQNLIILFRILQISSAVAVVVAFSKDMKEATLAEDPSPFQKILMGIIGSFVAIILQSFFGFTWRLAGEPTWFINSDLIAFPIWISAQAALMHVSAKGALGADVPRAERIKLGLYAGSAVGLMLLLVSRSGDVGYVLELLKPLVSD